MKTRTPAVTAFKYFINILDIFPSSARLLNARQPLLKAFLHTSEVQALESFTKQPNKHLVISLEIRGTLCI